MGQRTELPVIFTDLDGSLLDHNDYSFTAAQPILEHIKQRGYPVILNSSKTRAEMLPIQEALGIVEPFVCENGAAVYLPEHGAWDCHAFSKPRQLMLRVLRQIKQQYGFEFVGFADWTLAEIVAHTGLSEEQAALAAQREYTEPLLWHDSEENLQRFQACLAEYQLHAVQGGRFLSVMGDFDKAMGMQWLIQRYRAAHNAIVTIALGDSPNDELMLNEADIAVIIRSERSDKLQVTKAQRTIRTELPGPAGWAWAMEQILKDWK